MTSISKKKKCSRTFLDRGGEKGPIFRLKRDAMYHKKERVYNKKLCKEEQIEKVSFYLDEFSTVQ